MISFETISRAGLGITWHQVFSLFSIFIRFRVNLQQQFKAKISEISEIEHHSIEHHKTEQESEEKMFHIFNDTESYHLVIGNA